MFQTKTNVIDAVYHSNSRSELRIDPMRVYTGNIRLGNLGCTITNPNQQFYYNQVSGIYSLIQNIYLYDGTTLLDQITEAHHLLGFRTLAQEETKNNRNGFNFNVGQRLSGTTNSYSIKYDTVGIPNGGNVEESYSNTPKRVRLMTREVQATTDADTTAKGWMNLQQHFGFLKSMMYTIGGEAMPLIDTSIFKSLRLVIEWRSTSELRSCFQGNTTDALTVTILQPQLYCDEVMSDLPLPKSLSFNFNAYELDKVNCSGSTGAGSVYTKARSNAFNGKILQRLLTMNINPEKLTDANGTNDDAVKCDGSMAMNEVLQLTVNGETLFDFNGIDTEASKLAFLSDAWGDVNIQRWELNFTYTSF